MRFLLSILFTLSMVPCFSQYYDIEDHIEFYYLKSKVFRSTGPLGPVYENIITDKKVVLTDENNSIPFESLATLATRPKISLREDLRKDTSIIIDLTIALGSRAVSISRFKGFHRYENPKILNSEAYSFAGGERVIFEIKDRKKRFPNFKKITSISFDSPTYLSELFQKAALRKKVCCYTDVSKEFDFTQYNKEYDYPIFLSDVKFSSDVELKGIRFESLKIENSSFLNNWRGDEKMLLEDCEIGKLVLSNDTIELLELRRCRIDTLFIRGGQIDRLVIDECEIGTRVLTDETDNNTELIPLNVMIYGNVRDFTIVDCRFNSSGTGSYIRPTANNVDLNNNVFNGYLALNHMQVKDDFFVGDNQFKKPVCLQSIVFSTSSTSLDWDQFESSGLFITDYVIDSADSPFLLKDQSFRDSTGSYYYKELIKSHQMLHNLYKTVGDNESANGVYVRKKELEGAKLREIYMAEGGFRNLLRWRLNRLMKRYTEHGTEPVKAVSISIYVIVLFSVFYFFFPSEWDVSSKSELIRHFRTFVNKNEHGYFKPFLALIFGFLISYLNALTLSINAFTTLGFGNIPTVGIARYICILQGFLGWFLLSLFSVALINQVLF